MVPGSGFIHNNENNHLGRIWLFVGITLNGENHWVQTVVLERKDLWQQLRSVKQSIGSHARLILGDFNVVRDLSEKWDGLRLNSYEEFGECLSNIEVIDLPFSWSVYLE